MKQHTKMGKRNTHAPLIITFLDIQNQWNEKLHSTAIVATFYIFLIHKHLKYGTVLLGYEDENYIKTDQSGAIPPPQEVSQKSKIKTNDIFDYTCTC